MNESEALVALNSASQVGPIRVRLMLRHFGSALNALHASPTDWAELPGFHPKVIQGLADCKTREAWREDLEEAARKGIAVVPFTDPRYPKRLGLLSRCTGGTLRKRNAATKRCTCPGCGRDPSGFHLWHRDG